MVKKYKTILSVLLVVLIATGAILVTGVVDINKFVTERELEEHPELSQDYEDSFTTVTDINLPLLPTDIEDIFYTMDKKGDVKFYLLRNDGLTPVKETESFTIKAEMSGQTIPAKIHLLKYNGKTTGYGLFTNQLYDNVYIYDYAFFKVSDFFPNYSHSSGTLLLMADVDKDRFYSEDKVFSEIFTLSAYHNVSYFLNENQRTIDLAAKMRTDYKMFTDDIDDQISSRRLLFFSSRFYTANDKDTRIDIMSTGGSGENIDNIRYVQDVASLNLWRTDDGVYYFKTNKDEEGKETGGFALYLYNGEKAKKVKAFEGSLTEDYLIDGEYILNCLSGEVYHITDGKIHTIDYSNVRKGFKPDAFEICANGNFCAIRGANNRNRPTLILCDFASDLCLDYSDDVFGFISSMNISSDGSMVISIATDSTASSFYQLVSNDGRISSFDTNNDAASEEND